MGELDFLRDNGLLHNWLHTWSQRWWEKLDKQHALADGTLAATCNGELSLGHADWCDNPNAAARVLPAKYAELIGEWQRIVDRYLDARIPDDLAHTRGESTRSLFSQEEIARLRMVEPVGTLEEFLEVAKNFQRWLRDWQQRNPSESYETGKDNVLAYMTPEAVRPTAEGYVRYLKKRSKFFAAALDPEKNNGLEVRLPLADLRRHAYVVAGTGGGKTELLKVLAHEVAATGAGVLVIDPHGALAEDVAQFTEFAGAWRDRLAYLDVGDQGARPCLNPFSGLAESAVRDEAGEMASALQELLEERNAMGAGSTVNMRLMVKNCIRVLLRTEDPDLRSLYRFMNDAENGDLVDLGKRSDNEMVASFFAADFVAKERGTTKTAVRARLQEILDGDRVHLFCGPATIDVEQSLDAGKVVVLNLGAVDAGTAEAVGRFMMARLFSMAKRRGAERAGKRRPVFIIADEAHLYLSRSAGDILAQARKFGIHLIAAQQSVDQGRDPEVQKLLMTQSAVKMVGVTSQDAATRRAFANVLDIGSEAIKRMRRLQFMLSVDGLEPVIFSPRSDWVNGGRMSETEWDSVLAEQRAQYYRKPGVRNVRPTAEEDRPHHRLFPDE